MTLDQALQVANQHHREGRSAQAAELCRNILVQQSRHPDALHLLGILEAQAGRLDAAVELLRQAVQFQPDFPKAWSNLGCVYVNQGKLDEAISAYTRVTQLRPNDAVGHYALGIVLRDRGRLDEAIVAFSRATELKSDYAEAYAKLGQVLRNKERFDEALAAYAKAIALNPQSPDAHNNLGNVLRDKGLVDEAIAEYAKALQLKSDDALTCLNLGNALIQKERFVEAVVAYERALQVKPDYYEALQQMGFALASLNRFDEAMQYHGRALALRPNDPRSHEALGATLLLKRDTPAAEVSFRRALDLGTGSAKVWNGLGTALKFLGKFEEASQCFRRALALNPASADIYRGLILTGRSVDVTGDVDRLTKILNEPSLAVDERIAAGFALGKLLDEADRFDEAFHHFASANSLYKQARANSPERLDREILAVTVRRTIDTFTPAYFAQRRTWGITSEVPVFIVGMPRSGTSLVEQIAATHPDVFGAGELLEIPRLSQSLPGTADPTSAQRWDAESIANAASAHLEQLRSLGGGALRVIDKLPGNVLHLGLIAVLFPGARIIFCRRDPRDTCLSCYFQQFAKNILLFTYDLADCGRQFLETERLMAHWLKSLPLRMMEIHYEAMVADQEGQSRRLIDFLGLPWNPACLDFHRTERPVVTASAWQVRQPMYTRSVGRWRHYEQHLGPLLEVLADEKRAAGS